MTNLDISGHVYYILIAMGIYFVSEKQRMGWLFRFLGNTGWVGIGLYMGMTSIWIWGLVFMVLDLKGFFTWKEGK